MAVKDSVLNFVIKAKDMAGDVVAKFGKDVKDLDDASAKSGKAIDSLGESANDASAALDRADDAAEKAARELHESGVAADKAASSVGKMGQRYNAAGKPIETAKQKIKETNKELKEADSTSTKTGKSIASFAKRLIALAAAAFGIRAITNQFKSMLSTGDQFEKLGMQMEQAMGSIEGGKKATEWVTQFAKDTPLQMQEVTETFTRLKNFGIDPLNGSMAAIVDQAAALGGGYERVTGISLALGQAWAKQKLQGEEILQLIERGVPVWDLLEKATGKNTLELQKLSSAGALGRDVIQQLMDEMGKANSGAAAKNMTLLSGYVSNLKDEWQLFLNEIAKAGALDYAKEQLSGLLQTIQEMRGNGDLQALAKRISDGFITIAETSKSVVLALKDNIGTIALLAKAYVALKLAGVAADAAKLATVFRAQLAAGTAAAVTQTKFLAAAMRAIPWLAVVQGAVSVAEAYGQMKEAQRELAESQAQQNNIQAEASQRIAEFNQQTGLAAQSLDDLIRAQDAGIAVIDEYTGKWRLATDQLTEAEIAQRAQSEAAKQTATDLAALNTQVRGLVDTFKKTRGEGKTLEETIAAMGEAAKNGGERGIEALSISLERLALEGKATRQELSDGLGDYLASLSNEQFTRFGKQIADEIDRIKNSADATSNRLSFMQTLLEAHLTAAAKRAGVDIGQVLEGIDEKTKTLISSFTGFAASLAESGKSAEESDKLIKAGLLPTLESLNTSQEIAATRDAILSLGEAGILSAAQVQILLDMLDKKAADLAAKSDEAANKQVQNNQKISDSIQQVTSSTNQQTASIEGASGAAVALANAFKAVRATVDELGPAASAAFDQLQGIDTGASAMTDEFADLRKMIEGANAQLTQMRSLTVADVTGISSFLETTSRNAAIVRKEYAEQKIALERLKQQYDAGAISAGDFASRARAAAGATSLLGQQDLSFLRNAIKAAEDQMESFRDSTMGTLNSLQAELAQLQGDAAKVAELNYQARVSDLENQLEQAKTTGDKEAISNAQAALSIARQIYQTKREQIAAEKQAAAEQKAIAEQEKAQAQTAAQAASVAEPVKPQQPVQPPPVPPPGQRVELALPNGSTASLTGNPDDVNKLLEFLSEAGMRAVQ